MNHREISKGIDEANGTLIAAIRGFEVFLDFCRQNRGLLDRIQRILDDKHTMKDEWLTKQIPVKLKPDGDEYECPVCGAFYVEKIRDCGRCEYHFNYCSACGQKLHWNEEMEEDT